MILPTRPENEPRGTPIEGARANPRSIYRDHLLSCQPMRLDTGGYQPRVVITSMAGDKTRSQRFLDLDETFGTEDAAVDRARRAGMDWVDVNDRLW